MASEVLATCLKKMHYEVVGRHSAVQVCSWCKKSLLGHGVCYKEQFYGIKSHRCVQMTPCLDCDQRCIFCWRPHEIAFEKIKDWDDPKSIIEGCFAAQKKLLVGFRGNEKADIGKLKESNDPYSVAISLSGEPTMYPYLAELILELHSKDIKTFLVTNGQHPEVLEELRDKNALPWQLYVSVDAPSEELYKKVDMPLNKDGWSRLQRTLALLPDLNCRTVLRLTMIKDVNMCCEDAYAEIIRSAAPMFVEIKSYMHIGFSRRRMRRENMPTHAEILDFSERIAGILGWKIKDQNARSRVVLLARP